MDERRQVIGTEDGESASLNQPDRPRSRTERLDCIAADGRFDVIVVGGGINGIGVYRDLALQGLRVLLVERSDFCSGCSYAPSRMIHGGLRYLENGELSLVRDSLRERDMLLANAPHMVRALPVTVPIASITSGLLNVVPGVLGRGGRPAARGTIAVKLGLTFYDWLTKGRRVLPGHRFRGRAATLERWPALDPKIRCSATYFDAWISFPERLCVELIRDTERDARLSLALNHVHLSSAAGGGFHVRDQADGRTVPVTARVLVNATGAWVDETVRELAISRKREPRLVSGTKGSHLVLNNPALHSALDGHMLYFENPDRRICIALPYLDRVLVGSTDIRVDAPGRVRCEEDETEYLLASLRALLPGLRISRSDIVFSYSGVRPLPRSDAEFTGRIPRGYSVRRLDGEPPLYCMIGGKWTTFRAFAEYTADMVLRELGTGRRCGTHSLPIGGGRDFPGDPEILIDRLCSAFRVSPGRARHLLDHYGTLAPRVQAHCAGLAGGDALLGRGSHYTRGEIDYLVRNEFAVNLSDIVLRRTSLAITGSIDTGMLRDIAETMAAVLGWSAHEISRQMQSLLREIKTYHDVADVKIPCSKRETGRKDQKMRISSKARMNRMFNSGGCLDVAIDHGVCNEPSFMEGLEDMKAVVGRLVKANPDALQMAYGQADLLQSRPERDKPALVMRIDMGNPYNDHRHRVMWSMLQNDDNPIIGALEMDAACVVVNLFMLPDEPDLFRQCVKNISKVRAVCHMYGMPLMIEPLAMLPNESRGGYQVDGDAGKITTLVRLASEMGADIIKADPTDDPQEFHRVIEAARVPVLVRGGGKADLKSVIRKSAELMAQGAMGMVYGRNVYQHDNPEAVVAALMAMIHRGASGEEAWDIYRRG